jgi:Cobalamin-independent synthase, Catalytic domain
MAVGSGQWKAGGATGIGSHPGTDPREAVAVVLGELPDFPYLPELPARGPGADMIGRSAALLVDMPVETVPTRWRFADRPGGDMIRAHGWLSEDLDLLEERAGGYEGALKIQVAGPWTLTAAVELRYGDKALADPGAARDIAASLSEGLRLHVAGVSKRVPGAQLVVQLDEPWLPAVLGGTVRTASGFGSLPAVEEQVVGMALAEVMAAIAGPAVVHCCAARPPVDLCVRAGAAGLSIDFGLVDAFAEKHLGEAIESGTRLLAGVVPSTDADLSAPTDTVDQVRRWWRRLGFPPDTLAESVILTPTCGLAGASPAYARAALEHCREAVRVLAEAPEASE